MTHKTKSEKAKEISISGIAASAGVDKSHVSMILSGKRMPSLPVAKKIADAMGVSMDELCGRLIA